MQVRWSPTAGEDLSRIFEYIRQENPSAAERVVRTIFESAGSLAPFANREKVGRVEGTRELPFAFTSVRRHQSPRGTEHEHTTHVVESAVDMRPRQLPFS